MSKNKQALQYDERGNDYTLKADQTSEWITVDGVSVHIARDEDLVEVILYDEGSEMEEPVAFCNAVTNQVALG